MRILEQEQDRFLTRETFELVEQCGEGAATLLCGVGRYLRIPVAGRDRQQRSKKWCRVLNAWCGNGEQGFQFVKALLGR
ncbi:MAG: hypothetical protein WAL49_07500, partial [Pseudolabrys sp.]